MRREVSRLAVRPSDLVASVGGELAGLLQDSQVRPDDVRIEYGRTVLL